MTIIESDCIEAMREMPEASVDAIVTDPPYGLEFMGKDWDRPWRRVDGLGGTADGFGEVAMADGAPRLARPSFTGSMNPTCRNCGGLQRGSDTKRGQPACRCGARDFPNVLAGRGRAYQEWCETWAREALRVLKPGGHLLAFGGTRTYHRLVCAIEDAGFEIRDTIAWMYGSGFPKSLDVARVVRGDLAVRWFAAPYGTPLADAALAALEDAIPVVEAAAEKVEGHGTALKPAFEPIVVARKPLAGTVAGNVLAHGTGALNVDGCRVCTNGETWPGNQDNAHDRYSGKVYGEFGRQYAKPSNPAGRWPANVVLDPEAAALLDEQTGVLHSHPGTLRNDATAGMYGPDRKAGTLLTTGDSGGASRFFATFSACGNESIEGVPTFDGENPVAARSTPSSNTDGSGSRPTDPSQTDTTSTIRTPTPSTTISPTSNSSHGPNTRLSTEPSEPPRLNVTGSDTAPAASSGSPSTSSPSDLAGSDRGTASPVSASTCGSGAPGTETSTLRTCVPIEQGETERFRYCAKTSSAERNAGLDGFPERGTTADGYGSIQTPILDRSAPRENWTPHPVRNVHPTVKPIELMRWLVRLVTPPGGRVLDPFAGSGTTGCAAALEGFKFVGIEREAEYAAIARARIAWWATHPEGMVLVERLAAEQAQRDYAESGQLNLLADT